jgi:Septum formation
VSDNDEDDSDWLASQFNPTQQVPAQPVPQVPAPPVQQPPTVLPPSAPPAVPFVTRQVPAATPVPPPAAAPSPSADGGFNWGLRPGGEAEQPPAATPVVPAASPPFAAPAFVPPPLVSPPPATPLASPPTEPYVAPPAQPYVPEPTKPLSWDEFASTQQAPAAAPLAPPVAPLDQPTEAYTVQPWQPAAATSPVAPATTPISDQTTEPTSAIDSLFGDHQFQDYEEVGVLKTIQVPPTSPAPPIEPELVEPRAPLPTSQKVLMGVAAGLIAALILIGLFFLGEHLGSAPASTTASKSTNAPSATPTPAGTGGPATPGVQQWSALQGGECIQPFSSAWAITFTVVSCTADHDAQMVFKGKLPDSSDAKYPSAPEFQKEITPLCSDSTAINYTAAASVTDLQVSFSYPPNTASWLSGDRTYYCFVDRVSGGNLPGDLSVPRSP